MPAAIGAATGIASINSRASRQQGHSLCGATVVL
jgi:hypothetical protein